MRRRHATFQVAITYGFCLQMFSFFSVLIFSCLFAFLNPPCGFHHVLELGKQGELQGILEPGGSVNACYLLSRQTSGLRDGWWDSVPDLKELYRKEAGQMKLQPQQLPSPVPLSFLPHNLLHFWEAGGGVVAFAAGLLPGGMGCGLGSNEGSQEL